MPGYTDNFTATNGDVIDAPIFTQEYTALTAAFDATNGHKHTGLAGEGALIPSIADSANLNEVLCDAVNGLIDFSVDVSGVKTSQLKLVDGAIAPSITGDVDLGTAGSSFNDLYVAGTAYIGAANITNNVSAASASIVGTLTAGAVDSATIDGGTF